MYILKGRSNTRSFKYEDRLLGTDGQPGAIERGSLSDGDINFILKSGDNQLKAALDKKYRREKKNSDHVKRIHGNLFDNKANDGTLYKELPIQSDSFTQSQHGQKTNERIKKLHDKEFGEH